MTASTQFKSLLAGAFAVALMGTAMAQGNPPNPAIKSAPIGAGQQSTQKTPMGETGTPGNTGATAGSSNSNMGSMPSTNMGSTTGGTSGSSMGSSNAMSDTTMAASTAPPRHAKRRMRADRN